MCSCICLKRTEEYGTPRPKPGGKVWVKRQLCRFSDSEYVVKDHKHVRYKMVDSIPDFENVRKTKVVMQQILRATNHSTWKKSESFWQSLWEGVDMNASVLIWKRWTYNRTWTIHQYAFGHLLTMFGIVMVSQRKLIQTSDIELCCDLGSVFIDKDEYGVNFENGHFGIG